MAVPVPVPVGDVLAVLTSPLLRALARAPGRMKPREFGRNPFFFTLHHQT